MLSNSLTRILDHARDEYLFIYSVYVLEASTSNRLTYFIPPLNLIPLLLRPLRLLVSTEKLRRTRIFLLKITHFPLVAAIFGFEALERYFSTTRLPGAPASLAGPASLGAIDKRASYLKNLTASATFSQVNLPQTPRETPRSVRFRRVPDEAAESQQDLRALVVKLSEQVEELLAKQQS